MEQNSDANAVFPHPDEYKHLSHITADYESGTFLHNPSTPMLQPQLPNYPLRCHPYCQSEQLPHKIIFPAYSGISFHNSF